MDGVDETSVPRAEGSNIFRSEDEDDELFKSIVDILSLQVVVHEGTKRGQHPFGIVKSGSDSLGSRFDDGMIEQTHFFFFF